MSLRMGQTMVPFVNGVLGWTMVSWGGQWCLGVDSGVLGWAVVSWGGQWCLGPGPAEDAPVQYRRLKHGPGSPVIFKVFVYLCLKLVQ